MREAFFRVLTEIADSDPRITLITGDLGFGSADAFARRFPNQFVNAGVAEQNMTGIAAGMALSGKIVFTYSIGNFPTLRCLEQIRNDICYPAANVKIVAVGGGYSYGALGMSHHATEDLAIMRALPGLTVVAPGDPAEAHQATRALVERTGPCYLRLERGNEAVHRSPIDFQLGRAITICDGTDVTIISTGGMLETAMRVASKLSRSGVHARVLSMHTVSPLDVDAVLAAATDTTAIVTLEEHSVTGGLGSAVAEVLAERGNGSRVPFKRLGLKPEFARTVGSQAYLREQAGLADEAILSSIMALLPVPRTF